MELPRAGQHSTAQELKDLEERVSQEIRRSLALASADMLNQVQSSLREAQQLLADQSLSREEGAQLRSKIAARASGTELQELRERVKQVTVFVESAAESVFLGQRAAVDQALLRLADAATVDLALKGKADASVVQEISVRVARCEALFKHAVQHRNREFEDWKDETLKALNSSVQQQLSSVNDALAAGAPRQEEAADGRARLRRRATTTKTVNVPSSPKALEDNSALAEALAPLKKAIESLTDRVSAIEARLPPLEA